MNAVGENHLIAGQRGHNGHTGVDKSHGITNRRACRQSPDGSVPAARVARMNSAQCWHIMLVAEHGFAVERNATFHLLEPVSG